MEVEQVGFDGEGFVAEGWAHADVGDRIKGFVVDTRAGEVNAVTRHKVVIPAQVDGRDGVAMAIAAAASGSAGNAEDSSQQALRLADFSCADQRADLAAGNRNAAQHHHRIDLHLKSKFATQRFQLFGSALGLVAKVEILSFV